MQVFVFADWLELPEPTLVGTLNVDRIKGKEHFRFAYDKSWLNQVAQQIDPELHLFHGEQYSAESKNFRVFLDSCPDRWGRLLMKRREAIQANREQRKPAMLGEVDYLLGVHDTSRMGALRFKTNLQGDFLDNQEQFATPPMSSLRELEFAANQVEQDKIESKDYLKWLFMLLAPGSSLGGARPKASVIDENNHLWIAKFPSRYDDYNIGAWEFVAYRLAVLAGIQMSECRIERFSQSFHTFLTKRFDRIDGRRVHFVSALTQLGYYDGDYEASYLELALFLTQQGANTKKDLEQLWRRLVFNIAISNTDDHLRNHGFLMSDGGWLLSPAYDLNPVPYGQGLHLNITETDNRLDFDLAFEVAAFFQLTRQQANHIYNEVINSVKQWKDIATEIGISRSEQERIGKAFNF